MSAVLAWMNTGFACLNEQALIKFGFHQLETFANSQGFTLLRIVSNIEKAVILLITNNVSILRDNFLDTNIHQTDVATSFSSIKLGIRDLPGHDLPGKRVDESEGLNDKLIEAAECQKKRENCR